MLSFAGEEDNACACEHDYENDDREGELTGSDSAVGVVRAVAAVGRIAGGRTRVCSRGRNSAVLVAIAIGLAVIFKNKIVEILTNMFDSMDQNTQNIVPE